MSPRMTARESGRTIEVIDESIYRNLRRRATALLRKERYDFRMEPADLVHEGILRLVGAQTPVVFNDATHLMAVASVAMQRVLIDIARSATSPTRHAWTALDDVSRHQDAPTAESLAVQDALERLAQVDPRRCAVVKLRFYWGLEFREIGRRLSVSSRTAKRYWCEARIWLRHEMGRGAQSRRVSCSPGATLRPAA